MDFKSVYKTVLPHIFVIIGFVIISYAYFNPVLKGKELPSHDVQSVKGMAQELNEYYKETGKNAMWTNSMFGGMPAFQIRGAETGNIFHWLLGKIRLGLPYYHVGIVFLYLLGFYILLSILGINIYVAAIGAVAFAFGSYNIIIISAGHITKAYAIGLACPVIAGVLLSYKGKYILGSLITCISLGIQIASNHLQITYYLAVIVLIFIIIQFIYAIYEKKIREFLIASVFLLFAAILAITPSISTIWPTYEYSKYTTRGKSELSDEKQVKTSGLDKDYILNDYSYGIDETLTLLIPNIKGGASYGELSTDSETYKLLRNNNVQGAKQIIKQLPLYWGEQRFTAGPVYIGAIVIFLFIYALFVIKGKLKIWIITVSILSVFLAWGKHFYSFSDFFIDHFPLYNKFRTVSMSLVIISWIFPLFGMVALDKLIKGEIEKKKAEQALFKSFIITGGLCLILFLFAGLIFKFSSQADNSMHKLIVETLKQDRAGLLKADAIRSFMFILFSSLLLLGFIRKKIKKVHFLITGGILILIDLWVIDRRYLNNDNFVTKHKSEAEFTPSPVDLQILKDTAYYRVLNLTISTFNDASTSYFHKSIGGYHAAKLERYQELIERHISRNNMNVLNMLNTKYFILPNKENNGKYVQQNPGALGNAWFVKGYRLVNDANEEINALYNFNPKDIAIIDNRFSSILNEYKDTSPFERGTSYIKLVSYKPDELVYKSFSYKTEIAVFSEIYYEKGWKVLLDNFPAEYFRCNYVLRGMVVPAGEHEIKFYFKPDTYYTSLRIARISSGFIILLLLSYIVIEFRKKIKENLN